MEEEKKTQTQKENIIPTPTQVAEKVNNKNFNKSWLLVVGLVVLTAVLLVVSLTSRKFSPIPQINNTQQTNVSHTVLSVSETLMPTTIPGRYSTNVLINSNNNHVNGVELKLTYDPKELTSVDIAPGTFIPNAVVIAKVIDQSKGTIHLMLGTPQGSKGISGNGTIAVITFSKADNNETSINFMADSLVTDERYLQSVLQETVSATIGTLPTPTFAPSAQTSPAPTK